MYDPGQSCWPPERASVPSISSYTALPALELSPAPGIVLAGIWTGDGSKAPTQVAALSLGSTVPTPTGVCLQASGAERGAEGGKEQHRPDGNKLLLTVH